MKGTTTEAKSTNSYLDALKAKVYDYQQQLIREDELVNAKNMLNKILGIDKRSHMLIGIYKSKLVEVERAFLSQDEIETMFTKTFITDRLNQVKDIFLFSCFTGLAYADVKKLSRRNIGIGVDGERWIFINRTKTDTRSNIPLLPIASAILEKYEDHPQVVNQEKLLPILSNQKMNGYLKEIADLCGINKELTFHIARHTFATTVTLSNGVPIESVSKMLGHKNIKTTQHYAKILDLKVREDMKVLREKFGNSSPLKIKQVSQQDSGFILSEKSIGSFKKFMLLIFQFNNRYSFGVIPVSFLNSLVKCCGYLNPSS